MAGTIVEGRNVTDNRILTPDFCIIGSGAAGGVCALKLTEAGFDVLVLEEGINIPAEEGPARGQSGPLDQHIAAPLLGGKCGILPPS